MTAKFKYRSKLISDLKTYEWVDPHLTQEANYLVEAFSQPTTFVQAHEVDNGKFIGSLVVPVATGSHGLLYNVLETSEGERCFCRMSYTFINLDENPVNIARNYDMDSMQYDRWVVLGKTYDLFGRRFDDKRDLLCTGELLSIESQPPYGYDNAKFRLADDSVREEYLYLCAMKEHQEDE